MTEPRHRCLPQNGDRMGSMEGCSGCGLRGMTMGRHLRHHCLCQGQGVPTDRTRGLLPIPISQVILWCNQASFSRVGPQGCYPTNNAFLEATRDWFWVS